MPSGATVRSGVQSVLPVLKAKGLGISIEHPDSFALSASQPLGQLAFFDLGHCPLQAKLLFSIPISVATLKVQCNASKTFIIVGH